MSQYEVSFPIKQNRIAFTVVVQSIIMQFDFNKESPHCIPQGHFIMQHPIIGVILI